MMSISHTECDSMIGAGKNYLLVKCALCTKDMILTEGSIIFGSEWYHEDCFANFNSEQISEKESKTQHSIKDIRSG